MTEAFVHSGAHEASERIQAPLHSNLIAMSSQAEEAKEWCFYTTSQSSRDQTQGQRFHHAHSRLNSCHD